MVQISVDNVRFQTISTKLNINLILEMSKVNKTYITFALQKRFLFSSLF
jgi:hypothetical protein